MKQPRGYARRHHNKIIRPEYCFFLMNRLYHPTSRGVKGLWSGDDCRVFIHDNRDDDFIW